LGQQCRCEEALSDGEHRLGGSDRLYIKGNEYRLVVAVDFEKGIVWIKWIGTHRGYDRIDVREVDHERR
jgi:hypothetical protein